MLSILYGLSAALGSGAADFTGGLAARKVGPYRSVFYGEIFGLLLLFVTTLFVEEELPTAKTFFLSMLAGVVGYLGILLLYHSMTRGLMSIAAPVSALLAAAIPVVVGIFTAGLPKPLTILGFGFALYAVWMVSQSKPEFANIFAHLLDIKLPLLAGVGFGFYFVILNYATHEGGVVWPMIASRCGGILLILVYMLSTRTPWKIDPSAWWLVCMNGMLNILGNFFFILAGQTGRLDVTAILSGLFPGATVLLAWIFLRERLTRSQWVGILSALIAIILMTV